MAPARAATGPAASGATGRRWASTSAAVQVRAPGLQQRETRRGPAGHPGVRHHVPGAGARAQDRCAPAEVPVRGDGDHDRGSAGQVSPDDTHPERRALGGQPAREPLHPRDGQVAGMTSATTRLVGRAPIAATSARFCTAARRPTSSPEDHARRKCRSSTSTSVVTTNRPSGAATTAASSPGGTCVSVPTGRSGKIRARRPSSDSSATTGPSDGAGVSAVTRTR